MKLQRARSIYRRENGGYIALMATIIISLLLLVMIVNEGFSGWMTRFVVLGTEAKEQANALAEGCADQAVASLITDPSYLGNTTSNTPGGDCKTFAISPADLQAGLVTIKTQAVVRDAFANLELLQNVNNIHLGAIPSAPNYGTIIVQTLVNNPASGAQMTPADFTMNVASVNPSKPSFAGSATGVVVTIPTNGGTVPYSVSQSPVPGFAASLTQQCAGSIKGGDIKSCTVSNNPVTTSLTLIANVNNNDSTGTLAPSDIALYIDGAPATLGHAYTVSAGSHAVSATVPTGYSASAWGYQCSGAAGAGATSLNLGDNKICIINFDDNPPPAPICADTVMMLDRSGSMFNNSAWIPDEKTAAKALVDLYASVTAPHPLLGFGRFGDASRTSADIVSTLQNTYASIKSAIDNSLSDNNSSTNLADAISVGNNELNSSRHDPAKQKVLILISDGSPNQPSSSATLQTGFFSPSANVQNGTNDLWTTPANAYADGNGDATDSLTRKDQHRFYNFNLPALPSNATIKGIEAKVDAWATTTTMVPGPTVNIQKAPTALVGGTVWVSPSNAYTSNDVYATSATTNQSQSYGNFGFSIPANAVITGIQVSTEAKVSGSGTAQTTSTLYPQGQGTYSSWNGTENDVDETGTPDCSTNNRLDSSTNNSRESVDIDLSSIPTGSTVTSVQVLTWDQGNPTGGTYKTFARVGNADTDATANLTTTSNSSCVARTQTIDIPDFVKSSSSALQVGVLKVGSTNVRVGTIRAIVSYTNPATGSVALSVSPNNGGVWTASRSTALDTNESVDNPSGNTTSDLWGRTWTPADFADGKFAVRVQNTSNSGVTVSLDQVLVKVFYNAPVPAASQCDLGVDLSWNGGSNWSAQKTQTLGGSESTYTLGGQSDTWPAGFFGSHTWAPGDFTNSNFRARVEAIDSGSNCDSASVEHLDWLQLQVTYSVPSDPATAALAAADSAKISNTNIFTIYFGSGNPTLLAQLASGSTPNAGHQSGSYNDPNGVSSGTASAYAASAVAPNQFTTATRGFTNNNQYATDNVNGHQQGYAGFALAVPPGATISSVQVIPEAKSSDFSGCQIGAAISTDGGSTYTAMATAGISSFDNTYTLTGASALWGRSWSSSDFDPTRFVVKLTDVDPGNNCTNGSILSVDALQVKVGYSVNTENGDGDNFFVAPTSADMKGIFEFIGNQVCPAINNVASANPPTNASLFVITQVINNNSGSSPATSFTVNVVGTNASPNAFAGSDTPGKLVTIDPGSYSVTQSSAPSGYTTSYTSSCSSAASSNISAGESRVCVITNDDIPPPPPPPNLTITPGNWQEVPDTTP